MTVSTTTTINGPSTSKSTSKYPSFDDILERLHAELENYNVHIPIRTLIQECDNREKQSTAFLDFKRPDRAFVDYIVAYEICVNVVPQNQDFSRLKGDQAQLWRQYQDVRARIISKGETFSRIKNDMRKNSIIGGPTTGSGTDEARAMNGVPSFQDSSENDALSTLKSTQDIAYSSTQEGSELSSQALHGNSSPKRRPKVSPKPPNLHGKSFSTNSFSHDKTSDQVDHDTLAERFSKLRGTDGTNDVLEKSRSLSSGANLVPGKTSNVQSYIRMPSPKDFIPESRVATQDHPTSDRTLPFQPRLNGPRAMPSPSRPAPVLPNANPDSQLITLMPRPPSPAYSPATAFPPSTNLSQPRPITRTMNELGGTDLPPAANTSCLRNVDEVDQDERPDMGGNSKISTPNRKSQIQLSEETIIDAETLNDYFRKGSHNLRILVIDVRDRADFDEGHILTQSIICIEPIVVRPETSAEELEEALEISPDSERKLFARRDTYNLIVIYDQKSTSYRSNSGAMSDLKDSSALENLRKCLTDYSYKKRLQRDPILLRGGLDAWVDLVGPQLLATSSEPSLTEGISNSRQYSAVDRPIGRTPVAGALYNFEATRKRLRDSISEDSGAKDSTPVRTGGAKGLELRYPQFNEVNPSNIKTLRRAASLVPAQGDSTPLENYNKNYEDFHKRYPEPSAISESMVIPRPRTTDPRTYNSNNSTYDGSYISDYPHGSATRVKDIGTTYGVNMPPVKGESLYPHAERITSAIPSYPPSALKKEGRGIISSTSTFSHLPSTQSKPSFPQGRGLIGLTNMNNTCYMNSVLQALSHTKFLVSPFLDGSYQSMVSKSRPRRSVDSDAGVFADHYAKLMRSLWKGDSQFGLTPRNFRGFMRGAKVFGEDWDNELQQDAHDFLVWTWNFLQEAFNTCHGKTNLNNLTPSEEEFRESLPVPIAALKEWERYLHAERSFLTSIFTGQHASRIACQTCKYTATTYEAWNDISLGLPKTTQSSVESLHKALRHYTKSEEIEWTCPKCQGSKARKGIQFTRLPHVLVFHLKRSNNAGGKITTSLEFPLEGLDMTPFAVESYRLENDESETQKAQIKRAIFESERSLMCQNYTKSVQTTPPYLYRCFAIIRHKGASLNSGHYTTDARDQFGKWYTFDDSNVSPIETRALVDKERDKNNAFILFYERSNYQQKFSA